MTSQFREEIRSTRSYERLTSSNSLSNKTPIYYRSAIGSRVTAVQPARNFNSNRQTNFPVSNVNLRQHFGSLGFASQPTVNVYQAKFSDPINANREREKRDLIDLNNRFAQYVEKIRLLEAQNKKLEQEINALKNRSSKTSSHIKDMYDIEINEAQKLSRIVAQETEAAREKRRNNEQDRNFLHDRHEKLSRAQKADRTEIENLQKQIAENDASIALFRRRLNDIEDEARLFKNENQRLSAEINRLQQEIQSESAQKAAAEMDKIQAQNELTGLQQLHEADLAEIRARNISNENDQTLYFKNQLVQAIQENRSEYEQSVEDYRQNLEIQYNLLVQQQLPVLMASHPQLPPDDSGLVRKAQDELTKIRDENEIRRTEFSSLTNKLQDLRKQFKQSQDLSQDDVEPHRLRMHDLHQKLESLRRQYDDLMKIHTGLQKEIDDYRQLLEGKNGLRTMTERIYSLPSSNLNSNSRQIRTTTNRTETNIVYRSQLIRQDSDSDSKTSVSGGQGSSAGQNQSQNSYQRFSSTNRRSEIEENPTNYTQRENSTSQYVTRNSSSSSVPYETRPRDFVQQSAINRTSLDQNNEIISPYANELDSSNYQQVDEDENSNN